MLTNAVTAWSTEKVLFNPTDALQNSFQELIMHAHVCPHFATDFFFLWFWPTQFMPATKSLLIIIIQIND